MSLLLNSLAIYAIVCMAISTLFVVHNLTDLSKEANLREMRDDVFVIGVIFTILTSPFWIPKAIVVTVRILRQEIANACQSLDEDHQ
jgi:hypothetical protein